MAKSKIKHLIVAPLIASAIFLSSPTTFASGPLQSNQAEVHNVSSADNQADTKKGITGQVIDVSGSIILILAKDDTEYTVDASEALIMKEGQADQNPSIVAANDIHVGDEIMVRGVIRELID